MKHRELIDAVIFLSLLAVSHSLNTEMLSPVSEGSRKTFKNQTFTLDEAHKKCGEYLTTTLAEFLQKVPKTPNNDGTAKLGEKVEAKLNEKINSLMGKCDPTKIGVAQFVSTTVEPKENSLNVEQLVIQKIYLTPNLREVKKTTDLKDGKNCTNNAATSTDKPGTGSSGRTNADLEDCLKDKADLSIDWEEKRQKLEATESLLKEHVIELGRLKAQNEALIRRLNSSNGNEEVKIKEDTTEIKRLNEIIVVKDVEINRLNLEKITIIEKHSVEITRLQELLKNSDKTSLVEAEKLKFELEHNAKLNCDTEKANQKTQIDNLNNQLTQANALKSELDQCKQDTDNYKSNLSQKETDCKTSDEKLRTCEANLTNCNRETSQSNADLKKCNDDKAECSAKDEDCKRREATLINEKKQFETDQTNLQSQIVNLKNEKQQISNAQISIQSSYNKTLSILELSLENERITSLSFQTQWTACKTDKDSCNVNLQKKETDCKTTESELGGKITACENTKLACETNITKKDEELTKCKAESASLVSESAKNLTTCEIGKTKASGDLSDCQSTTQILTKAIAGKLKIQEQIELIISSNKDTDLSVLTVTNSASDTRQQTISRQILDEKASLKLKTTCSP